MTSWISAVSSGFKIRSAVRPLFTMTSRAGTRPPSRRITSRWQMTPRSAPARLTRTWFCWYGGKKSTIRFTVSVAFTVCSVERTRWPVSDAAIAALTVSMSRISPMKMTSGSSRIAARIAVT